MYSWLWRHLPGPTAFRIGQLILLAALATVLLFGWVFPWLEPKLPFDRVTVTMPTGEPADMTAGHGGTLRYTSGEIGGTT